MDNIKLNQQTADELAEQDSAIDAFQMYSDTVLNTWVLTQEGFFKAVAHYLNSLVSEGCPLCQKPDVLAHWQNMLKEYERFMMETETEITKRMITEYEVTGRTTLVGLKQWLNKEDKK